MSKNTRWASNLTSIANHADEQVKALRSSLQRSWEGSFRPDVNEMVDLLRMEVRADVLNRAANLWNKQTDDERYGQLLDLATESAMFVSSYRSPAEVLQGDATQKAWKEVYSILTK